jgi:hypothetical protein
MVRFWPQCWFGPHIFEDSCKELPSAFEPSKNTTMQATQPLPAALPSILVLTPNQTPTPTPTKSTTTATALCRDADTPVKAPVPVGI